MYTHRKSHCIAGRFSLGCRSRLMFAPPTGGPMIALLGNRYEQPEGEMTMTKLGNKDGKASPARKATKKTTSKKTKFREGSFLEQVHGLLSDGQPHPAEEIVKAIKAEKHLI